MAKYYFGSIPLSTNNGETGVVLLETDANTVLTTSNSTAVTPTGLGATLGSRTLDGVAYGRGVGVSLGYTPAGTNGQIPIGATGSAPAMASITSSSLTITPGANTLNIEGAPGGWVYQQIATNQTFVNNVFYGNVNGGSATSIALPAAPVVGNMYRLLVCQPSAGGIVTTITQAAFQVILYGNLNTTIGVGGSLTSTQAGDCIELLCRTSVPGASFQFQVVSSLGNWTIV